MGGLNPGTSLEPKHSLRQETSGSPARWPKGLDLGRGSEKQEGLRGGYLELIGPPQGQSGPRQKDLVSQLPTSLRPPGPSTVPLSCPSGYRLPSTQTPTPGPADEDRVLHGLE